MARNWRLVIATIVLAVTLSGSARPHTDAAPSVIDAAVSSGPPDLEPSFSTAPPTTQPAVAPPPTQSLPVATGWQTTFADTFDAAVVDPAKWSVENRPATNMGEMSFYSADNVFTRDGQLVIKGEKRAIGGRQYATGQITSKYSFSYGRVEVRAKMPVGQGFWPALWMLPTDGARTGWLPEVDLYESVDLKGRFFANFHWRAGTARQQLGPVPVGLDVTQWHTYGLEWTADALHWLVDGDVVATTTEGVAAMKGRSFFLIVTFGMGGSWPGPPNASTPLPAEMLIDWIRVLQR